MNKFIVSFGICIAAISWSLTTFAEDWPQWRGPNRDGISKETGLVQEWPKDGPPVAWKVENAGVGYSSIVVAKGRVFTQGDIEGVEHILCYSEKDGTLQWAVQPAPVAEALDSKVESQMVKLDKNEDGEIDEIEAMEGIGRAYASADRESDGDRTEIATIRAKSLVARLDKNGDGILSYPEIPRSVTNDFFNRVDQVDRDADVETLAAQRAAEALELDADKDSKVSNQEAKNTLVGQNFSNIDQKIEGERRGDGFLTGEELTQYFATRARGRDGTINAEELQTYYERTYPNRDGILSKADVRRYYGGFRNGNGDGPRGTPTVDGERLYAEGGFGDLTCLDVATGKTIWHVNLQTDLGGGRPGWGYCESPLVVNDWLIVTPGGNQGTIAALDKKTGEVVWRSKDVKEGAHYSSPLLARIAGTEQIVQFARNSVFGVKLDGGSFLWKYSGANNGTANISTPVIDGDYVLAASGYGTGAGLVRVTGGGDDPIAEEIYFEQTLANHHGGLVKVGDHVYGFGNGGLICMKYLTGEVAWKARSVNKGSLTYADGHLYCLGERNEVALVEANPEEYTEKGRFSIPKTGRSSWPHPVVANGKLYIRDQNNLTCYSVSEK